MTEAMPNGKRATLMRPTWAVGAGRFIAGGDTIIVLDSDKVQHRVRIAGIDATEKGQPFGNISRKRMSELVARKEVRVEFNKHDRCRRIVWKVLVTPPDCPTCGKILDVGLAQVTTTYGLIIR